MIIIPNYDSPIKFSICDQRNGTSTGPLAVETGRIYFRDDFIADLSLIGQIRMVRGQKTNSAWRDDCNKLEGTVPGLHRPNMSGRTKIYETELERPIELREVRSRTANDEQKVRKFVWSKINFLDWFHHTANLCYQSTARWTSFNDEMGGTQRKSNHRWSTPTVFSWPHFLFAENTNNFKHFNGLKPNRTLHESYIEVEFESGAQVYERRNLQVNIDTSRTNVPLSLSFERFFPVYWFSDESKAITAIDKSTN